MHILSLLSHETCALLLVANLDTRLVSSSLVLFLQAYSTVNDSVTYKTRVTVYVCTSVIDHV